MNEKLEVEQLISQCRSGSAQERCAAIVDLEEMGAQAVIPVLLELLDFSDAGVRANVAHALGELGDKGVGVTLLTLLHDSDSLVRINAAESLGLLRYKESLDSLVATLHSDKESLVRLHAAEALGSLKDVSALPALTTALDDPDESVRAYAADSIGSIGAAEMLPILGQKLESEQSTFTRAYLLSASYRLGAHNSLNSLVQLSETADDVLAVTILNLAVELATTQNAVDLKDLIKAATQSRPSLHLEVNSLIERLDSIKAASIS